MVVVVSWIVAGEENAMSGFAFIFQFRWGDPGYLKREKEAY